MLGLPLAPVLPHVRLVGLPPPFVPRASVTAAEAPRGAAVTTLRSRLQHPLLPGHTWSFPRSRGALRGRGCPRRLGCHHAGSPDGATAAAMASGRRPSWRGGEGLAWLVLSRGLGDNCSGCWSWHCGFSPPRAFRVFSAHWALRRTRGGGPHRSPDQALGGQGGQQAETTRPIERGIPGGDTPVHAASTLTLTSERGVLSGHRRVPRAGSPPARALSEADTPLATQRGQGTSKGPCHRGGGGHPGLSLLLARPAASLLGDGAGPPPRCPALSRCSVTVGGGGWTNDECGPRREVLLG